MQVHHAGASQDLEPAEHTSALSSAEPSTLPANPGDAILIPLGPMLQRLAATASSPAGRLQHPLGTSGLTTGLTPTLPQMGAAAPQAGGPAAGSLLEYAAEWVRHADLVGSVWADLRQQADEMPGCRVELLPAAPQRHPSTAFRSRFPPNSPSLL